MVRRDNANELALIAEEIGAEVIRGSVMYPGHFFEVTGSCLQGG